MINGLFRLHGAVLRAKTRLRLAWLYWRRPSQWWEEAYGSDPQVVSLVENGDWRSVGYEPE